MSRVSSSGRLLECHLTKTTLLDACVTLCNHLSSQKAKCVRKDILFSPIISNYDNTACPKLWKEVLGSTVAPQWLGGVGVATYHHGVGTGQYNASFQQVPLLWHSAVQQSHLARTKHNLHCQASCLPFLRRGPAIREVGTGREKQCEL